jgi:hypothetical protein
MQQSLAIKIYPASEPCSDAAGKLSTTLEDFLKGVVSKESEAGSLDFVDAATPKEVIPSVLNLQHDQIHFLLLFLSSKEQE